MYSLGNIKCLSRIFHYYNRFSPDLNQTFDCIFNNFLPTNVTDVLTNELTDDLTDELSNVDKDFISYHILNGEEDLNNIEQEQEQTNNTKSFSFKSKFGPYKPSDIKKVYSVNSVNSISGIRTPIITIIACHKNPYLVNDVNKFGEIFKLPKCKLEVYNFSNTFNYRWAMEVTLDVQWAYAMNPNAIIRVVLAKSASLNDVLYAIKFANNKNNFNPKIDTDIISMSFGMSDNGRFASYNTYFSNPNIIYLAASGDSSIVAFPSSCTNVIATGGTTLKINNSIRSSEHVWRLSGCGYSNSFSKPFYQPGSSSKRSTPDFSAVADPNTPCYVVLNSKLYSMGGTSLACPIIAGMLSLVQQAQLNKKKPTYTSVLNKSNSIQPILYSTTNKDVFYDITQGKSGKYSATKGFDIASGLGVLNLSNFIDNLNN